jgi:hypothetical protein
LKPVVLDKRRLNWVEFSSCGESFDRRDVVTFVYHCQRQAAINAAPVRKHCACAALSVVATFLRSCEREILAQQIKQGHAGIY